MLQYCNKYEDIFVVRHSVGSPQGNVRGHWRSDRQHKSHFLTIEYSDFSLSEVSVKLNLDIVYKRQVKILCD